MFGVSLTFDEKTPLERNFKQTSPTPRSLCGAQRTFQNNIMRDTGLPPTVNDKRVLIKNINPETLKEKSARKIPKAIESQQAHESRRQQCIRQGIEPEWPITFRSAFIITLNSSLNI